MNWDKQILRVFPKKTSYTPEDPLTYYPDGIIQAPMFSLFPKFDEIHISCSFTWDKDYCIKLQEQYQAFTDRPVKIGGPGFVSAAEDFVPGLYLKPNIIFTSRGCNNQCPWCIVPKIEGYLKELPICPGNIVQDNNFLQTSKNHKDKMFEMLRSQRRIQFKGGLQSNLIDDHFVENVRSLKIDELWLACDTDQSLLAFRTACKKLVKGGFNREKIKCYVLIGDDMEANENRLQEVYRMGAMPFAQLVRDFSSYKTEYSMEWKAFARQWQRPASIKAHMERGTQFRDYST
ncbi:hypothetical protein [Acetobacterium sp.]|uniref:hypothetical protein n=1 Tax=Acetobacterium sp. TaxID=1872094 RepID=UPI0027197EAA|nr:hypothetical protein [Acetobacterium sp.]MDO9491276.1 hypothetical protein [Acetobacterium sp.]